MIQQRDLQVTEFVIAPQATTGQVQKTPPWLTIVVAPSMRRWKRLRVTDYPNSQIVALVAEQTPSIVTSTADPVTLQPTSSIQRVGVALSFNPLPWPYKHTFTLQMGPLPSNKAIQKWRRGECGYIVDSLGKALLMLDDMEFEEEQDDSKILLVLKWNSIVVRNQPIVVTP